MPTFNCISYLSEPYVPNVGNILYKVSSKLENKLGPIKLFNILQYTISISLPQSDLGNINRWKIIYARLI